MPVSFQKDVMPIFYNFKGQMMWRFDLTSYEDVKNNAEIILGRIDNPGAPMPPPPMTPLTADEINTFKEWINDGFPA